MRYPDNIFGLWEDSETSFREFVAILNCHHPQIKLKYNLQKQKVKFLDMEVFFTLPLGGVSKNIATKVYFLPLFRRVQYQTQNEL